MLYNLGFVGGFPLKRHNRSSEACRQAYVMGRVGTLRVLISLSVALHRSSEELDASGLPDPVAVHTGQVTPCK